MDSHCRKDLKYRLPLRGGIFRYPGRLPNLSHMGLHPRVCAYATINCVSGFSCIVTGLGSSTLFGSSRAILVVVGTGAAMVFVVADAAIELPSRLRRAFFFRGGLIPTESRNSVKLVINRVSSRRRSGAACTSPLKPKYTVPL